MIGSHSRTMGLALFTALTFPATSTVAQPAPESFARVQARSIGPAGMSGRVSDVEVVLGQPGTIFVGAATGGVWRSVDGGLSWAPVFDDAPAIGVGAIEVSPADPNVVWVGTGEGNPRNSAGVGYGIYRSEDGGDTWAARGLTASERIHRIIAHPTDPDIAWVGAMGPAWSDGEERGVFRTTDGGETWERILFTNERSGVGDMVSDPRDPDRILVAMWEFRRWPWFFESGGPGSGLFLTEDGGDSWTQLTAEDGLPSGTLGRSGLSVFAGNPDVIFALVEAERSALIRSSDGGRTWTTVNDQPGIANRPFYYADIRVDPLDPNRIYNLASSIQVSRDGGLTFETVVSSSIIHGDVHELWIHPANSQELIMGNDGGIAFSHDGGDNWRFVENLPIGQFYHVTVDDAVPFNLYGGMQDNGSWFGPSNVWESRGIMNAHWYRVGGGDGFWVASDPSDADFGWSMSQQGALSRFDKRTGDRNGARPASEGEPLRFNWNAGFALDPHEPGTIYQGSQFLHRSRDGGANWEIISPDLTTDDPEKQRQNESGGLTRDASGAENHTTIITIAPSPLEDGLIWVGTDDGNVQITRDDGGTWTNLADRFEGVPPATWVPKVEASNHDPAVAYVVFEDHRRGGWDSFLFRTEDYGATWERLPTSGIFGFLHVVEEDPEEPNLLFAGGEFGLWFSLDRGSSWTRWVGGIPGVPVRDLVVHPRDADLAIATHGRAMLVLDDIRPLRAMASDPSVLGAPVTVFDPPPAIAHGVAEGLGYRSTGMAMQFGETRPRGSLVSYWVGPGATGSARIEVLDAGGQVVATLDGPVEPGLNRVVWDLRMQAAGGGRGGGRGGRGGRGGGGRGGGGGEVAPGTYTFRVTVGDVSSTASGVVLPDPRIG